MKARATTADQGVLNTRLFSDGRLHDMLYVDGGPSSTRTTGHLRMQGKEVFRHAVTNIAAAITASARGRGHCRRRHRLVRAAPGQPAHPGRHRQEAGHRPGKGDLDRGAARQHLGRLGAPGAGDGGRGTAASSGATWCCWRPWAAALPGAPPSSAGSRRGPLAERSSLVLTDVCSRARRSCSPRKILALPAAYKSLAYPL